MFAKRLFLVLFLVFLLGGGCERFKRGQSQGSPVRGVLTRVSSGEIELMAEDQNFWHFSLSPEMGAHLEHLQDNMIRKQPVRVYFRTVDDQKIAVEISD